jgi:hypothetical protein
MAPRPTRFVGDYSRVVAAHPTNEASRLRGDEGVTLALVGVMMVVLLAFCAFAVDIGAAFAVRRQSQSAADSAVMGAAQEILDGSGRAAAASYAKVLSHDSIAFPPSEVDWDAAFVGCSDSGQLAASAPSGGDITVWDGTGATSCVSFSGSNQRIRVRIPAQTLNTAFAQLVGLKTINVSTSAEALINITAAGGGALPYAITGMNSGSQEVCLQLGAGNIPVALCNGGITGNFGPLDFSIYGNDAANAWLPGGQTTLDLLTACSANSNPLNAAERLALNDIIGVDHPLGVVPELGNSGTMDPSPSLIRNDRTLCQATTPPNFLARPNEVATQTGSSTAQQGTEKGLVHGFTYPGGVVLRSRFDRYCGLIGGWDCVNLYSNGANLRGANGSPIDDTPLWELLSTDLEQGVAGSSTRSDGSFKAVPASCLPSAFTTNPDKSLLHQCFTDYNAGGYGSVVDSNGDRGTALFGKDTDGNALNDQWDILIAPRFGFVPLLWNPTFPNGQSDPVQIRAFRPVYFQTMLLGCNNNSCDGVHNPGEPWSSNLNSNKKLEAISAMTFPLTMLPPGARDVVPTAERDLQITLVR